MREAAVWFLDKFVKEKHPYDYWPAAGMAILRLSEQSEKEGLSDQERGILQQVVGNNPSPVGRIDTVAEMVLLEDKMRGMSEEEKLPEYDKLLKRNDPNSRNAFLLVRRYQVPSSLQRYWNGGPRYEKTGRPSYEDVAGQLYWRFRSMKFSSSEDEMLFLWQRIQECYANLELNPALPEPFGELRYEEAFAATARLIEMRDAAVPFLLKHREFILTAYDPADAHAKIGFNFELEVMRASRNPEFKPLLRQLARSAGKVTHLRALEALSGIEHDAPGDFVPHYIFYFDPPNGI